MNWLKIWERISAQGTSPHQSLGGARRIRLTNQLAIACAVITLGWSLFFASVNPPIVQLIFGVEILIFFSIIWWNRQQMYFIARYLLLGTVCFSTFMVASCFGPESLTQLIFIPIFLGATLIFNFKRRMLFWVSIPIPILFCLLTFFPAYSIFLIPDLTPATITKALIAAIVVTLTGSFLVIWYYLLAVETQEAQITKINKRFKGIFEHSLDAIFLIDLETLLISDCNHRAVEMLEGASKQDFIGTTACRFQAELREAEMCQRMRMAVRGEGYWKAELKTITLKDELFWGQWGISLLPDESYEIGLVRITDIQAQKETEFSLLQSQAILLQGQELARMGNTTLDLETNYSHWSDKLYQIFGVEKDFVPTMENVFELIHPDDRASILAKISSAMKERKPFETIYRAFRANDGKEIYIQSKGHFVYEEEGKQPKLQVVVQDITEQKLVEKQLLIAKEQAEAANKAKGHFLTSMSHEIRTPLNGILGFTNLLLQGTTPKEQKHYLELIQSSGDILLRLLSDILDFNKVDQGQLTLEEINFDFRQVITHCLKPYKLQINEKGLAFELNISPHVPTYLAGDTTRIRQIVVNLVSNAMKFTENGEIKVSFSLENDTPIHDDTILLRIEVQDTGIGIPPEKHETIFQAFSQADSSTTRKYGGSGLGLAIVCELSKLMGGELHLISPVFSSNEAPGTIFRANIPLKIGKKPDEIPADSGEKNFVFAKEPLILLVEDNRINQVLSQKLLNKLGASVLLAENGREAVQCVERKGEEIDLILMDIQMPLMNGYEATQIIRQQYPSLPIVALSANAYKEDIEKSRSFGMNDYLSKPFKEKELFTIANKWMAKKGEKTHSKEL